MKLTIEKRSLLIMTQRVQGGLGDKNFSFIGLKSSTEGTLIMNGKDRALSVYCEEECKIEKKGVLFVTAKLFCDVVKEFPNCLIEIYSESSQLILRAKENFDCTIKLPTLEELQWQDESSFLDKFESVELESAKLSYLVEQVQFCINQDSPRVYGAVGYLHSTNDEKLRLVGTDGFRLSLCEVSHGLPGGFLDKGICVSKRGLNEITRMSNEGFDSIKLSLSNDQKVLAAEVPGYKIYILLSSVSFPKYQSVIPKEHPSVVSVDRSRLFGVMKRVLLAADKTRTLKIHMARQLMTISSRNVGNSEGCEKIRVDGTAEQVDNLAINGKFLSDVVSSTNSSMIDIRFNDDESPILVTPKAEPDSCRSLHVLVPIKESH